jgi:hypothetical protein
MHVFFIVVSVLAMAFAAFHPDVQAVAIYNPADFWAGMAGVAVVFVVSVAFFVQDVRVRSGQYE